jgi:lipopolysaccharide export system protein LptC
VPVETTEPGYSARDAELTETGADGRALYRLNAKQIRQRPEDGSVLLEQVQMTYRGQASNQWALTANEGTLRDNNEQIKLTGDVRVVGVLTGTSDLAQIRSEHLDFDTRSEIVTTDDPVTLLWGTREIQGTGLKANLKDQQVRLESGVHGSFAPH